MVLGEKIICLRKQKGWSQEQLAEKLDVSRQSVSKWESGTSVPELDKIVRMSSIFEVTTDWLLKDEAEEEISENSARIVVDESKKERKESVCRTLMAEEAEEFIETMKQAARKMAFAISLLIMSPVCLLVLAGISQSSFGRNLITENMAGGLGAAVLLVIVAAGVGILISNGMKISAWEYLEKESFRLDGDVQRILEEERISFEGTFRGCITAGVVLCIVAVLPLLLTSAVNVGEEVYVFCTAMLLIFVAAGVFLFVWSGMIHGSYDKILQRGDYTPEKKDNKPFSNIYWSVVVVLYLAVSFLGGHWGTTWIIWPIAGVLYAAIDGVISRSHRR